MWRLDLAFILAVIANPLMAQELELSVANRAKLDDCTLDVFRTELSAILSASGRPAVFSPEARSVLRITVRQEAPEEEAMALGRIQRIDGRLVPEVELFVAPTAQLIGTRLAGILGRALARVAAHELGHWLTQESGHAKNGLMMERLSAAHLIAPSRRFFLLPVTD